MQKGQEFAMFSPQAQGNRLVWQEGDVAQSRIAQHQPDSRAENDTFLASTSYLFHLLPSSHEFEDEIESQPTCSTPDYRFGVITA